MNIHSASSEICHALANGEFKPKTNLEFASFLGDTDLESVVMRYAHGECHFWTIALLEAPWINQSAAVEVFCLLVDGALIHSGIFSNDIYLDAAGVHTKSDLISHWSMHGGVELEVWDYDELHDCVYPTEQDLIDTKDNIEFWYKKTRNYLTQ